MSAIGSWSRKMVKRFAKSVDHLFSEAFWRRWECCEIEGMCVLVALPLATISCDGRMFLMEMTFGSP